MSELTAKFKFLERQSEEGAAGEDEEDKPERIFDPIYARENANAHMQTAVQAQQQALYGAHTMLSDWMVRSRGLPHRPLELTLLGFGHRMRSL